MSKLVEVKAWIVVEVDEANQVYNKLDEVLGFAVRQRDDFECFGVEQIIDLGDEE